MMNSMEEEEGVRDGVMEIGMEYCFVSTREIKYCSACAKKQDSRPRLFLLLSWRFDPAGEARSSGPSKLA